MGLTAKTTANTIGGVGERLVRRRSVCALPAAVLVVAEETRAFCEKIAASKRSRCKDYHKKPDLAMMCGAASVYLARALRAAGVECQLFEGVFHCAVWVGGCVVDITATQYGTKYPKVLVLPERKYRKTFKTEGVFRKKSELSCEWPKAQLPVGDFRCPH